MVKQVKKRVQSPFKRLKGGKFSKINEMGQKRSAPIHIVGWQDYTSGVVIILWKIVHFFIKVAQKLKLCSPHKGKGISKIDKMRQEGSFLTTKVG